jgi:MFS family permease
VSDSSLCPRWKLAVLFFLTAAAMGMWSVPLGNVLRAHGLEHIIGYAFACSAVAAFISPLAVGALADQRVSPVRLLRWLGAAAALSLAVSFLAIERGWGAWAVLLSLQVQAICAAPTFGLATSIVMASLTDAQREFGPIRAQATLGWMVACWAVSFLFNADTSTLSGFGAAGLWLAAVAWTFALPETPPLETRGPRDPFGFAALALLTHKDHRVVFLTAALYNAVMAAFYPFTPIQLTERGVAHATAAMSLGQVTELVAMFGIAGLLARVRLKWVFLLGIGFCVLRYAFCALDTQGWLLAGVTLHGFSFTLYFITAQLYLEQRIDPRLRARAQALLQVMIGGAGNLVGYLGTGWWRGACTTAGLTDWPRFWWGMCACAAAVLVWFAVSYRGRPAAA